MTEPQTQPSAPVTGARPQVELNAAGKSRLGLGGFALLFLVFLVFPLVVTDPAATTISVFAMIFMVAAVSWNIFSGYSGYLALGHAVFYGTGAYAVALAAQDWHVAGGWITFALLPFGGLVAGLVAIPVGLVALRVRKHTFVVVTIAIFFIFQLAATNLSFTGGTSGMLFPLPPWKASNNDPFYYVGLAVLIPTVLLSWGIRRSRFGLQLLAIRDDEDRALGLGVRTRRVKLTAFVISAIPVGMMGGLYGYYIGQIYPSSVFDPLFDLGIALMAFSGGLGTLVGPLLGALVLESMQQYLTLNFSNNATYLIAYGVLFLIVILLMPRGVVPAVSDWLARRRARSVDQANGEPERRLGGMAGATR